MKSFTIYKEYFDLITLLPHKKEQSELLLAICNYMFYDESPILNDSQMKIFINLKRPLDKSKNRSKNSSNENQNEIKIETKQNQNVIEIKTNDNRTKMKMKSNENQNEIKLKTHQDVNVNVYVNNYFNNLEELVNYIQTELNYKLNNTPIEINTLNLWIDKKISKEIIKYAFEESKRRNISDINYINKIVESCLEKIRLNKEKTNQDLPIWFDKKIEKNEDGLEEMEEILKDF